MIIILFIVTCSVTLLKRIMLKCKQDLNLIQKGFVKNVLPYQLVATEDVCI